MNRVKVFIKIMCFLLFIFFASCEKGNETAPTITQQPQAVGPDGKITLTSFVHSSGAKTEFSQLSNSSIVIQVTFPADNNPGIEAQKEYTQKIHAMVAAKKSYDYIYSELAGDKVNKEHLGAIKNADLLYKKALENASPTDVKAGQFQTAENYVASSGSANARTESCIGDYYNDNYGANWFLKNYCTFCKLGTNGYYIPGLPDGYNGNFATNVTVPLDYTPFFVRSFSDNYIMAAGFDTNSFITLNATVNGGGPSTDYVIPPRHISFFSIGPYDGTIWTLHPNHYTWPNNTSCSRYHFTLLEDL